MQASSSLTATSRSPAWTAQRSNASIFRACVPRNARFSVPVAVSAERCQITVSTLCAMLTRGGPAGTIGR